MMETDAGPSSDSSAAGTCVETEAAPTVVSLRTTDGVDLEADLYATGITAGPTAVLLHMIPPSNDRTNYPRAFIDAVTSRGVSVLNLDRRASVDAYTGPAGKLDAQAAVEFLLEHPCAFDPSRITLVGASNGTTTAVDYTVFADAMPEPQSPAALVFLTGGTYTENQNPLADHRPLLEGLPIQFVFSTSERAWSAQFEAGAPGRWRFEEYADGAHGTGMFDAVPGSVDVVADFIAAPTAI